MSAIDTHQSKQSVGSIALSVALAGLIGEVAFELYAWLISPSLFGAALQPSKLVMALAGKFLGIQLPHAAAFAIHFTIGSIAFGIAVYLIRLLMPTKVWLTGLTTGLILWFVAQGILAPVIGRSFMMGFGPYTQSSFIGHVGMTVIMAHVMAYLLSRVGRDSRS